MKSLKLRYSDNLKAVKYILPVLNIMCFLYLLWFVIVAGIAAAVGTSASLFKTLLVTVQYTSIAAVGVGLALYTIYHHGMLHLVKALGIVAREKGYLFDAPKAALDLYNDLSAEIWLKRKTRLVVIGVTLAIFILLSPYHALCFFMVSYGFMTLLYAGWFPNIIAQPIVMFGIFIVVGNASEGLPIISTEGLIMKWFVFIVIGGLPLLNYLAGGKPFVGNNNNETYERGLDEGMLFGSILKSGLIKASQGTEEAANIYGFGQNFNQAAEAERVPGNVSEGQRADSKGMLSAQEAKQAARNSRNQTKEGE